MMIFIKINFYFHGKEKSLKVFTIKNLMKSVKEFEFEFEFDRSEDPALFLNDIKN